MNCLSPRYAIWLVTLMATWCAVDNANAITQSWIVATDIIPPTAPLINTSIMAVPVSAGSNVDFGAFSNLQANFLLKQQSLNTDYISALRSAQSSYMEGEQAAVTDYINRASDLIKLGSSIALPNPSTQFSAAQMELQSIATMKSDRNVAAFSTTNVPWTVAVDPNGSSGPVGFFASLPALP